MDKIEFFGISVFILKEYFLTLISTYKMTLNIR